MFGKDFTQNAFPDEWEYCPGWGRRSGGGCAAHGERQCGIYVHTLLGGEGFLGSKEVA